MGSGCVTTWAGVGYVARGGSLLLMDLFSFSFIYILLNTRVVNFLMLFYR